MILSAMKIRFLALYGMMLVFTGGVFTACTSAQTLTVSSPAETEFIRRLAQVSERLEEKNARELSPLRSINRSYEEVQQALALTRTPHNEKTVLKLLKRAYRHHKDNTLALLLIGTYLLKNNSLDAAAPYFQLFIEKSDFPTKIEKDIIYPEETAYFKNYLTKLLTDNGYALKQPHVPLRYSFLIGLQRLNVFPHESLLGVLLTIGVLIGLVGSIFYLMITRQQQLEPSMFRTFLFRSFGILAAGYFLWMVHLYFGINPFFGYSLVEEISAFLIIGFCGIVLLTVYEWYSERQKIIRDPDSMLCPSCKNPVLKIATECPHCKHLLTEKKADSR